MKGVLKLASLLAATVAALPAVNPVKESSTILSPRQAACNGPATEDGKFFYPDMDRGESARGKAPFQGDDGYAIYKNVVNDFGAVSDGTGDQSQAFQNAILDQGRQDHGPIFKQPRSIFIPGGTYQLQNPIYVALDTILFGDPNNPPVLKAGPGFTGDTLVSAGSGDSSQSTTAFNIGLKNLVLDTTAIAGDQQFKALFWGIAQGCFTENLKINMPTGGSQHVGIDIASGSTISVADVSITGGGTGITNNNQQVMFKNLKCSQSTTCYNGAGGYIAVLQSPVFDSCGTGARTSGQQVVIIDATSTNSGEVINGSGGAQIVLENISHDSTNPVAIMDGNPVLSQAHTNTWVWGQAVPGGYQTGTETSNPRPTSIAPDGKYYIEAAPSYANIPASSVINVKAVADHPVLGDGSKDTDDGPALNAILQQAADECKVAYFPFGVYNVKDTVVVPPNSRIIGEGWATIIGSGDNFKDASNPRPIVRVGDEGSSGVAHIQDMRFTVGEVLPGAIIVQINMAGAPGDVAIWNSEITIGGDAASSVTTQCNQQDTTECKAAFLGLHLSASSSAYIDNVWVWTADHDVDSTPDAGLQIISTGRGVLVEATKGTWLVGIGSEHHWLYNLNYVRAENVYSALQQTESPYMQGAGAVLTLPAPWDEVNADYGDLDWSWCDGGDQRCRTNVAQNFEGGKDLFVYGGANWAFFDGEWNGDYGASCDGNCQTNMNRVGADPTNLQAYSMNVKSADNVFLDSKNTDTSTQTYGGSWGGIIDAYRVFSA
ncbi:hypothetical protein FH972_023612 [Carpinus fangiana]|uniref:Rhamnogalacturonase A/B/Epimerase-like pectate lyase domain-containing protein n=1 Tax=Carpinus fangiana TaxID=176857 RepID=A0A5N6KW64_9ROSI|nr:hypothetical protein FH972_023612 [Carpinus fangiana]